MFFHYNIQVKKGYMNKPIPHLNDSDPKDRMTKKCLKEFESYYIYQRGAPSFLVAQS